MISNQILQSTIEGLKNIARIDLCVCDTDGNMLASTFGDPEITTETIVNFTLSPADSQVVAGFQFFKVFDEHQLEYVMLQSFLPCKHRHCLPLPALHIQAGAHQIP